jgi:hypothetical protein
MVKTCIKKVIKAPLPGGGGPLYKDANLNPYWSHSLYQLPHFLAPLSPFPGPKHPLFPPPIHTCEHLTDNNDINLLDSFSVGHSHCTVDTSVKINGTDILYTLIISNNIVFWWNLIWYSSWNLYYSDFKFNQHALCMVLGRRVPIHCNNSNLLKKKRILNSYLSPVALNIQRQYYVPEGISRHLCIPTFQPSEFQMSTNSTP